MTGFGPHLMLDGYGCDKKKLTGSQSDLPDPDELPNPHRYDEDHAAVRVQVQWREAGRLGPSGFVLIAESHISIHTFPEKNFVSVDIFSCKGFDAEFAEVYFRDAFEMVKAESRVLDRGTEFPKSLNGASRLVRAERRASFPSGRSTGLVQDQSCGPRNHRAGARRVSGGGRPRVGAGRGPPRIHDLHAELADRPSATTSAASNPEFSSIERARVVVLPVPYDFTTTYQGGTRWGPRAILSASQNMELWDEELGATYRAGIHTLPELEPTARGPEAMVERVEQAVDWISRRRTSIPAMLGGEHSITAGAVRAAAATGSRSSSVLQLDAHADMRDVYLDIALQPRLRHAADSRDRARRRRSASGRSARRRPSDLERSPVPMWSTRQFRALGRDWSPILDALTDRGVRDLRPRRARSRRSCPRTGTPEPGGLDWYEAVDLLAAVSQRARIVGFDVVELAPIPGQVASDFLAARLAYRLMGLALQSQRLTSHPSWRSGSF